MDEPDPVELFKLLVRTNHSLAAVRFWMEHFAWGSADRPAHLEEFQRASLNQCREMFRWLCGTTQAHPTLGYVGNDICQHIINEVTCGYGANPHYREAALVALDDPLGDLFFTRLEKWEDFGNRESDDEPNAD